MKTSVSISTRTGVGGRPTTATTHAAVRPSPRGYVEPRTAFGATLRRMRIARGWTLRELCDRTGVDIGTLSNYETGTRHDRCHPTRERMGELRDALMDRSGDLALAWLIAERDRLQSQLADIKTEIREFGR